MRDIASFAVFASHSTGRLRVCYNESMQTPFPGMDPYLEHRALWPDVHNSLIIAIRDAIVPMVAPNYYVSVESRAYVLKPEGDVFLGRPDVSVIPTASAPTAKTREIAADEVSVLEVELPLGDEVSYYYLEIRSVQTHQLITAIELLSPVNKVDQRGRFEYEQKRYETMMSRTNFVEIDLLRAGEPMPLNQSVISDYRILVSRGWTRRKAHLYAFSLRAPIPSFPLPLLPGDAEPLVPLNEILHALYTRARFDLRIDYTQPPTPPLPEEHDEWVNQLLRSS